MTVKRFLPTLLVACTLLMAFWLLMAKRSARPFEAFDLTAADFVGFQPAVPGWDIRSIPVSTNDPAEPNIAAFIAVSGKREDANGGRSATRHPPPATRCFLIRLVHGYNMPMCMKIKGYEVMCAGAEGRQSPCPHQLWRVTSSAGDTTIWVTTMIKAGDFAATGEDIRSMAFPRVDVPDDPRWVPRGFSWSDVKHPWASLRRWARARWNASRTDVLTFLRLRQPAWASEELLTYVTRSQKPCFEAVDEAATIAALLEAHAGVLQELQAWRRGREGGGGR
jgi:hypothetical protein